MSRLQLSLRGATTLHPRMRCAEGQFRLAASATLSHHIVSSTVHIIVIRSQPPHNVCMGWYEEYMSRLQLSSHSQARLQPRLRRQLQFELATSTTLSHHIVSSTVHIIVIRSQPLHNVCMGWQNEYTPRSNEATSSFASPLCNLNFPPASCSATISYLALSISLSSGVSHRITFVWDGRKNI
jgi:hypothetical protein